MTMDITKEKLMNRIDNFTVRLSVAERQLITAIAQRLERTESDTMRLLVREKARELGVLPLLPQERNRAPRS
jgi:predicted KAP-like P-loop ATPase